MYVIIKENAILVLKTNIIAGRKKYRKVENFIFNQNIQ